MIGIKGVANTVSQEIRSHIMFLLTTFHMLSFQGH